MGKESETIVSDPPDSNQWPMDYLFDQLQSSALPIELRSDLVYPNWKNTIEFISSSTWMAHQIVMWLTYSKESHDKLHVALKRRRGRGASKGGKKKQNKKRDATRSKLPIPNQGPKDYLLVIDQLQSSLHKLWAKVRLCRSGKTNPLYSNFSTHGSTINEELQIQHQATSYN